jgi:hypothetical protein
MPEIPIEIASDFIPITPSNSTNMPASGAYQLGLYIEVGGIIAVKMASPYYTSECRKIVVPNNFYLPIRVEMLMEETTATGIHLMVK